MSVLTIFFGIIIFILLFTGLLYLYKTFLSGAIIYDLKKDNPGLSVIKHRSPNYYFSLWVYVNSFVRVNSSNNTPEPGKPLFYFGEAMNDSGAEIINESNSASNKLVYLQLGANSPKLQYYYTTNTSLPFKFINITDSLPLQKWVHIIVSTSGGVIECYLDGKLVKSVATSAPVVRANENSLINIGRRSTHLSHDTFISKVERQPTAIDAKTANNLYMKGPGTGLNTGNKSKYDVSLQLLQNNSVIKSYSTKSLTSKK